ncbi:sodium:calcium antiporter [Candidatus Bathyarchaeota archaeon]|nr:sodium:calcium antiporter [Candidatus Bathyarchaeota archaeon]
MTTNIPLNIAIIIASILLIYLGSKTIVFSANRLAKCLKIQKVVVGSVLVASITSLPEIFSSVAATFLGTSHLAFGNLIGSNIYNIPLIIGICGLIGEYKIKNFTVGKDCLFMIGLATFMTMLILATGMVTQWMGAIYLALYPAFIYYSIYKGNGNGHFPVNLAENKAKSVASIIIGGAALVCGTLLFVYGTINIIESLGILHFYAGLTIMALGCIIPEAAVSISAALHNEREISIGNVIGDNVITMTLGFGIVSLIKPFPVSQSEILCTMPFMILITFVLYTMSKGHKITRTWGLLLLTISTIAFIIETIILAA